MRAKEEPVESPPSLFQHANPKRCRLLSGMNASRRFGMVTMGQEQSRSKLGLDLVLTNV